MVPIHTPEETAKILKVSVDTIFKWVRSGKLKASMIGGSKNMRITETAINEFLNDTRILN